MTSVIRSWNLKQGQLNSFGDVTFDRRANRSFDGETKEAVRKLTVKILESDAGSRIATDEYRKGNRVITAIVLSEEGLKLHVNGKEHVLEMSPFMSEIRKVQELLERQKFIPVTKTEKTRAIFSRVIDERKSEANAPTLVSVIRAGVKKIQEVHGVDKEVNKVVTMALGLAKLSQIFAALGGLLLSITGLSLAKSGFNDTEAAWIHANVEKFFLACADLFAGINVMATSVLFLIDKIGTILHKLAAAAFAGAALPVTVFMYYATSLLSSIYKLCVQLKFKSEFGALVGNGTDQEIYAALTWLKQKTQISDLEATQLDEKGILGRLHKKWEQFSLRTQSEVFEDLFNPTELDRILTRWEGGDILEAKKLIDTVKAANANAIKWSFVSILGNTIGVAGMTIYLTLAGHVGTPLASALFALATLISICIENPKARREVKECLSEAMQKLKEYCTKSEKSVEEEGCSSTASSITSDQKEDFPQTLSKHMVGTLAHLLAS